MPGTIKKIEAQEQFEHTGDLVIEESIGEGATVIVIDGSLLVCGSVGNQANISLRSTEKSSSALTSLSSFFVNARATTIRCGEKNIHIIGTIGDDVKIKPPGAKISDAGSDFWALRMSC